MSSPALQWLLDREALRQLMVDYFCGVDDRDFDRVAACFAPDVRADYGQVYSDRESLIEFIRGVRFFHTTMHGMGQQVVALDGGEARMVSWAMLAHHGRTGEGEPIEFHNSGPRYVDWLTREDGRWLVRERGGATPLPAERAPAPSSDDPALRWLADRHELRDAMAQRAQEVEARHDGLHSRSCFLGQPVIEVSGDEAILECSALLTERPLGEPGKHPVLGFPIREERTRSERWRHRLASKEGRWSVAPGAASEFAERAGAPDTADAEVRALIDRELIRDTIARSALASGSDDGTTDHLLGNQEIRLHGDEARVRSYVYRTGRENGGESHWGRDPRHWHDRLERREGCWRIVERRDEETLVKS